MLLARALARVRAAAAPWAARRALSSFAPVTGAASLSEEEAAVRDAARAFARAEVAPRVRAMDAAGAIDPAVIAGLQAGGFFGLENSPEHGGAGAGFVSSVLVIEELARVDASVATMVDINLTICCNILRAHGSAAVQDFALPLLSRSVIGAFALSEAGSGSDAFALKTVAKRVGGDYELTGSKQWISNSREAGLFIVFANADPSAGYRGITAFLVERDSPGLTIGRPEDKLGIRASSCCPLTLEAVRVPAARVVGKVGQGYKIAIEALNEGRIGIAAQMLGIAQGAMDVAVAYAFQRRQFGQRVADFQGVQHQIAQAATEIEAARALTYNAARLKMAGQPFVREAAMAKLFASQVAERTASKAVEWMGGMGFVRESGAEKFFRDSKIGAIYEGTSNIQLNTIAKLMAADLGEKLK
jgi:short/branched chain acyl-CoA dehydrogenase